MATPVVAGSVALMMQANPALTPNEVKAILQYTAQLQPRYNRLTQGVGFLNTKGAVELARFFMRGMRGNEPSMDGWSRELIWGNHLVRGGSLTSSANAWQTESRGGRPELRRARQSRGVCLPPPVTRGLYRARTLRAVRSRGTTDPPAMSFGGPHAVATIAASPGVRRPRHRP